VAAQCVDPRAIAALVADLGVELRGIGDVVPMGAARHSLQIAGGIAVRDAERIEIRHDDRGGVEGETGVELKPVGGNWHRWRRLAFTDRLQRLREAVRCRHVLVRQSPSL
jgi:hypothetical protein